MSEKEKKLDFEKRVNENAYLIYNPYGEHIGYICQRRVGRFMHWCLEPLEDTFWTNGCLKEVTEFITKLYGEKNEKRS